MDKIVLLGCGGHAKSVADSILQKSSYEIAGFVKSAGEKDFAYRGIGVIGVDDDLQKLYDAGIHHAFICIGYLGHGDVRSRLYDKLKKIGYTLPVIIDPSAVLAGDARIGEGTFVGKGAIINANASIGKMAIINTAAVVEHDCVIGDFSHVAAAGVVCGNVSIGANAFLGANATVLQCLRIGANVLVGAGAVVVRDVLEACTVVGVPGEVIKS